MKKKIKTILLVIILIVIAIIGILYFKNKDTVAVLCYHNIATAEEKANFPEESDWVIDVENFEEQLKYLKKHNYKTLTMEEFYQWKQGKVKLPVKSVLITFDDGFLSNYHYAFPLLQKYNMNATVFVIGENVDSETQTEWDGNILTYMTGEMVMEANKQYPNIQFCSHSYSLHYKEALKENSYAVLHDDALCFGGSFGPTEYYAYPFGQYNHNMITALQETGYKLAFIYGPNKNDYRKATLKDDNFKIPRLNVSHGMEIWKFGLRLWW